MNKKRISIFGATGSVGQNTLDLISRDRESYEIVVLTAAICQVVPFLSTRDKITGPIPTENTSALIPDHLPTM